MTACPKPQRIKSKALTNSAEGQACTLRWRVHCDGPETVVFCHVRMPGDGIGTKPPDFWGYFGCAACHRAEELGAVPDRVLMRAIRETQTLMWQAGLLYTKGAAPK